MPTLSIVADAPRQFGLATINSATQLHRDARESRRRTPGSPKSAVKRVRRAITGRGSLFQERIPPAPRGRHSVTTESAQHSSLRVSSIATRRRKAKQWRKHVEATTFRIMHSQQDCFFFFFAIKGKCLNPFTDGLLRAERPSGVNSRNCT